MTPLISFLYLLGIHTTYTLAGTCVSLCRDPDDCPPGPAQPPKSDWQTCPSRPANGAQWACQAPDVDFPTVAYLSADMRTCGLIGQGGRSTIFYSFGAATVDARTQLRDTLDPKGVMFNDALDEDYWNSVISAPKFHMDISERTEIFVARYAEAMATVSTGEVFLVVKAYDGQGGGQGAYQRPLPGDNKPNVWRLYEFPTLQRNAAVTMVTSLDLTDNLRRHVDWQPNSGHEELPASPASGLIVPALPEGCVARKRKRQATACATCITFAPPGGPTGTITVSGTRAGSTLTTTTQTANITPALPSLAPFKTRIQTKALTPITASALALPSQCSVLAQPRRAQTRVAPTHLLPPLALSILPWNSQSSPVIAKFVPWDLLLTNVPLCPIVRPRPPQLSLRLLRLRAPLLYARGASMGLIRAVGLSVTGQRRIVSVLQQYI